MHEPPSINFIIRRLNVNLHVELLPSRRVRINPYLCLTKNLRLWKSISQIQAIMAQLTVDTNKQASAQQLLRMHFTSKGWSVLELES